MFSTEGLPGVGKTTVAIALARHKQILAHFSDGVLWASAGPRANALVILAAWATALGEDISSLPDVSARHQAVQRLIGPRRLLLVLDDIWDRDTATALRCGGPRCGHLLTTRDKDIARTFAGMAHAQSVPPLAEASAYQLLAQLAPEVCAADPSAAQRLARAVGGLPLALELLGGYLAAPEHSLYPDMSQAALSALADPQRRLQLAQERLGSLHGEAVTLQATIALSLENLLPPVVSAFYALGAFAPKPERFSRAAAEAVTQADTTILALLVARNLVEIEGEGAARLFALHQILADVARTQLDAAAAGRHRDYYWAVVQETPEDWQRIESVYGQIQWAWWVAPDNADVLEWVGGLWVYQQRRGLWRDSLAWTERALCIAMSQGWRSQEGSLLNNLGMVYDALGQRDKALDYYQQALPIREEVGDRAGLATTRFNRAMVYHSQGRLAEAVAELKQVVELDQLVHSPDLENDRVILAQIEAERAKQQKKVGWFRRLFHRDRS